MLPRPGTLRVARIARDVRAAAGQPGRAARAARDAAGRPTRCAESAHLQPSWLGRRAFVHSRRALTRAGGPRGRRSTLRGHPGCRAARPSRASPEMPAASPGQLALVAESARLQAFRLGRRAFVHSRCAVTQAGALKGSEQYSTRQPACRPSRASPGMLAAPQDS
ncbi:hypothetical protein Cde04nite_05890 [Cellulomonas denverensis]|nr:hypothetical protein Cde04nite_05890 [Cellulomonas denverensis]